MRFHVSFLCTHVPEFYVELYGTNGWQGMFNFSNKCTPLLPARESIQFLKTLQTLINKIKHFLPIHWKDTIYHYCFNLHFLVSSEIEQPFNLFWPFVFSFFMNDLFVISVHISIKLFSFFLLICKIIFGTVFVYTFS